VKSAAPKKGVVSPAYSVRPESAPYTFPDMCVLAFADYGHGEGDHQSQEPSRT
jgi:hypothetical protein